MPNGFYGLDGLIVTALVILNGHFEGVMEARQDKAFVWVPLVAMNHAIINRGVKSVTLISGRHGRFGLNAHPHAERDKNHEYESVQTIRTAMAQRMNPLNVTRESHALFGQRGQHLQNVPQHARLVVSHARVHA